MQAVEYRQLAGAAAPATAGVSGKALVGRGRVEGGLTATAGSRHSLRMKPYSRQQFEEDNCYRYV